MGAGTTSGERMHKARHTAGQRILDKTGNLKAVQKFLGHASIQTTADIYTDWDIDQLADTLLEVLRLIVPNERLTRPASSQRSMWELRLDGGLCPPSPPASLHRSATSIDVVGLILGPMAELPAQGDPADFPCPSPLSGDWCQL